MFSILFHRAEQPTHLFLRGHEKWSAANKKNISNAFVSINSHNPLLFIQRHQKVNFKHYWIKWVRIILYVVCRVRCVTRSTLAQNGHNCAGVAEMSGEWNLSLMVGFYVHLLLYTLHISYCTGRWLFSCTPLNPRYVGKCFKWKLYYTFIRFIFCCCVAGLCVMKSL